ncbi:MAG TPA: hypothetical protein VH678_31780 [Xanthobacteraceae bacterium]|jgi:hypothetical protein
MFEFAKKLTGFYLGAVALPPWLLAALAAGAVVGLGFVAVRNMRRVSILSIVIVCIIAGTVVWVLDRLAARDFAAERRALDERAFALSLQAFVPGSALACLEPLAPVIQDACEKTLFAGPETVAAAVAYVTAELELLSDARKHMQASGVSYSDAVMALRSALERDQFGVVAHVFATRRGCRPEHCDLFALLQDAGRVRANLGERPFEASLALHAPEWAAHNNRVGGGIAGLGASAGSAMGALRPGGKLFFPSSSSIPSVNIMTPESAASQQPAETTASAETPGRPRKPQERVPQPRQSQAVDSPAQSHAGPLQLAPQAQ